jgi:hypothetical protein
VVKFLRLVNAENASGERPPEPSTDQPIGVIIGEGLADFLLGVHHELFRRPGFYLARPGRNRSAAADPCVAAAL